MRKIFTLLVTAVLSGLMLLGAAPAQASSGTSIDVNMSTHQMTMYKNGYTFLRVHISGGGEYTYCSQGSCQRAHTPRGTFYVQRKVRGAVHAPLGTLYNPMYFYNGYALHGSYSVPSYHASHGCVRLPMSSLDRIYDNTPIGTRVRIHD